MKQITFPKETFRKVELTPKVEQDSVKNLPSNSHRLLLERQIHISSLQLESCYDITTIF